MGIFPSPMKQFVTKSLTFSKMLFYKNWKEILVVHTFLGTSLHVELHLSSAFTTEMFCYHKRHLLPFSFEVFTNFRNESTSVSLLIQIHLQN